MAAMAREMLVTMPNNQAPLLKVFSLLIILLLQWQTYL
jgi:hypothetical protein